MASKIAPSKPTLGAIIFAGITTAANAWDWASRENALQGWLDANRSSIVGQTVGTLVSWAPGFIVLALLLWWHDVRSRPQDSAAMRPVGDNAARTDATADVQSVLSATQQALKSEQRKNLDLAARIQELAQAEAHAEMLRSIVPLIRAYRATHALLGDLVVFKNDMEQIAPSGNITLDVQEITRVGQINAKRFDSTYRYRLISLCTELKQNYGILHPTLTDERLVRDVFGGLGVQPFVDGLEYAMTELQKMLADAAGNLNV